MTVRIRWKVDRRAMAIARVRHGAEAGLDDASGFLLEDANRTVPIEEATLMRSGGTDRDGLRASVFYDTPYARAQHENTTLRHDQGRRAKWLEKTLNEQASAVGQLIGRRIREAFS